MTSKLIENLRGKFVKLTHPLHHKNDQVNDDDDIKAQSANINQLFTDDILEIIFFNINNIDLTLNVCLVCKRWYNIIGNDSFWKRKYNLNHPKNKNNPQNNNNNNINHLFKLKQFNILVDRNYLNNPCGNDNLNGWHCAKSIWHNPKSYDFRNFKYMHRKYVKHLIHNYKHNRQIPYGWSIVNDKNGHENMDKLNHFFTGFLVCEKLQIIDFKAEKKLIKSLLNQNIHIQLKINESYSTVRKKYSLYNLKVLIIDDQFNVIDRFFFTDQLDGSSVELWKQVDHVFSIKQPFRYVLFYHAGQDSQFFLGFYGTRITNGSIKFVV